VRWEIRARPLRARPTPNVAIINVETARRTQGRPPRPIVSRETRARSGQARSVARASTRAWDTTTKNFRPTLATTASSNGTSQRRFRR
jgi:hypothetical protein